VLVVAAGYPNLILPQMVRTGAVVIDVGINRLADGRLVGDVDFAGVVVKASYITPVPGGVGLMTVSMLLINTITSCERWLRYLSIPAREKGLQAANSNAGSLEFRLSSGGVPLIQVKSPRVISLYCSI
jgi:methylenetetrahydrofolate dehydrogenase (NADP+) / methenyltetrahydrofolate cyclohydrolase